MNINRISDSAPSGNSVALSSRENLRSKGCRSSWPSSGHPQQVPPKQCRGIGDVTVVIGGGPASLTATQWGVGIHYLGLRGAQGLLQGCTERNVGLASIDIDGLESHEGAIDGVVI